MLKWTARSTESYLLLLAVTLAFVIQVLVVSPSIGAAPSCPGPALCGKTCSLDPFGTPIYCSNGQCTCAPGYDTQSGPGGIVCQPIQPEVIGTEARDSGDLDDMDYNCSGVCTQDSDGLVGGAVPWSPVGHVCQGGSKSGLTCLSGADCAGTCGPLITGQCQGGQRDGLTCNGASDCPGGTCIPMGFCSGNGGLCERDADCTGQCVPVTYKAFDLVPVHGIAPGGEAFMPVWGHQAAQCGDHGVSALCSGGSKNGNSCSTSADCPAGTCTPVGTCQGGSNAGGICFSGAECVGTCGALTTGQCQGGTRDGLTCHNATECPGNLARCVPMGFCSGHGGLCQSDADCTGFCLPGEGRCSIDGRNCGSDADCPSGATCNLVRTWAGCTPDPFTFCFGLQDSDEGDFDFNNCSSSEGSGSCGDVDTTQWAPSRSGNPGDLCGKRVSDFTDAWPFIDRSNICAAGTIPNPFHELGGVTDPARIDFPNNVIVYRAPTRWEEFSDNAIDHDYTWDTSSPGHELHDTDTTFAYHQGCGDENHGRVHTEFDRLESVNHFTDQDWGAANLWWRQLRSVTDPTCCYCAANPSVCIALGLGVCAADPDSCAVGNAGSSDRTNTTRCFVKSFVNPALTCPTAENVDGDCSLHDPMAVTVGVPSLDCADDAYQGTSEIHPVLGMAIRIQEDPSKGPEQWAFFYRQTGGTGPCGGQSYSRCLSTFELPLGLPVVAGNGVLKGANVHVDWHAWAITDDLDDAPTPTDVTVDSSFDLTNGTVLAIRLPHFSEGVVGLVTVTPSLDTTPPTITCPGNITTPPDLGMCSAVATFTPTVSDDCSAAAVCSSPSGTAFPLGTTTDTCTATDQAGQSASCSFTVTVAAANKCPQGEGYWKNHTELWAVNSLTLGSVTYTKPQLINIMNSPIKGDASVILAKQLITTLLNLANGSNPVDVCNTIADANSLLAGCTVPCGISPSSSTGQAMISDANSLQMNSGGKTGCVK